jgi:ppGpp synthetase/RelA/SpoT-type nucleotidyltranferase
MTEFSGNEIKKLGKRLRDGATTPEDLSMLDGLRSCYDPLLICMSGRVDELLATNGFRSLLSGRSKRTKSIIRKLRRPENHGMDLSRMGDIVGLRVLLTSTDEQDRALQVLSGTLEQKAVMDHRGGDKLYRSLHLIVSDENHLVEIQLRTLPQHVWAVESEVLGEKAKEGSLQPDQRTYLKALSHACAQIDAGTSVIESHYPNTPFLHERQPLSSLLPHLIEKFGRATATYQPSHAGNTFIVVFDNELGQLLHQHAFAPAERSDAIAKYRWITAHLSDTRFETLIFNSFSSDVLGVTHPRFCTSTKVGQTVLFRHDE